MWWTHVTRTSIRLVQVERIKHIYSKRLESKFLQQDSRLTPGQQRGHVTHLQDLLFFLDPGSGGSSRVWILSGSGFSLGLDYLWLWILSGSGSSLALDHLCLDSSLALDPLSASEFPLALDPLCLDPLWLWILSQGSEFPLALDPLWLWILSLVWILSGSGSSLWV
ncbi:unnamed protein product [Pleuronectes platessa]|uniref:Uncharacterized protein n=1 Tax=Pleuronectes platessa TaxID=8262 RepID=A0A9N7Y5U6_PLEPL|nr:unnamed protein product [Pleuronectes platessa]